MEESSIFSAASSVPPEVQFAQVLENFQMSAGNVTPFDVTQNFISISAARALEAGKKISDSGENFSPQDTQEFTSWDLETKLWHLVTILYSFRLSEPTDQVQSHEYSSFSTKQKAFLQKQPKLQELILIIQWLQHNSQEVSVPYNATNASKWTNTRVALQNKSLASLTESSNTDGYVDSLDVDSPLRSSKTLAPADLETDAANFHAIYNLVLAGDYQRAVDHASQTGNFTLALILVGTQQDYVDPVIDGDDFAVDEEDTENSDILKPSASEPSGLKHKYLWLQTVYNLSQEERLSAEERLIYSYLSGGDQTENIKQAGGDWDNCLLLYINQLLTHHFRIFMKSSLSGSGDDSESLASVLFPTPQHTSVENILNTMSKSSALSEESKNPFRVIMGSVLINQLNFFLDNTFKSAQLSIVGDQHILRVLAHLAVVSSLLGIHEGSRTPTKIITRYISKLSEHGYEDLVPIYLAFIPDEKDVRECYSIFLSTITDSEKRTKQLEIFKRLGINSPSEMGSRSDLGSEDSTDEHEYKIHNVLKRTVERVMSETEEHYVPDDEIKIEDSVVDDVDFKLCKSVEWFFENRMYEDAINATRTVFHRFLSTGRLKAIKEFGRGKNLKSLLKDYDFEMHTRSLGGSVVPTLVSETDKVELIQYEKLLECLLLLDEWKSFTSNTSGIHWVSKDVENSIEKVVGKIQTLIFSWFREIIESSPEESELYKEYRSIYVPYFIIELLQIFHDARLHDWKYMRQAFQLVNEVANDKENDFLSCFMTCGRVSEFVVLAGEVAAVAADGNKRVFV
ncbi:hypothetical protein JCM33374_g681 [Metschnikowia sp. JCM 33374]|nr:hypothetical protein JCM33374_g681 [Metschnikowia sp. JCM 33374]